MSSVIVVIALLLPDQLLLVSLMFSNYRKDEIAALTVVKNRCGKTDHSRLSIGRTAEPAVGNSAHDLGFEVPQSPLMVEIKYSFG